jgi:glycosyltransferase involved in cell wall biosynthesis
MIRIAFITPVFPFPLDSGIRIRIFHMARHLGHRFQVRVFSLESGDTVAAHAALGFPIETIPGPAVNVARDRVGPFSVPRGVRQHLRELVEQSGAELLHVEMDYAAAILGLPVLPVPIPVVLDSACTYHMCYRRDAGLPGSLWQRSRALVRWYRMQRYETALARAADVVLAVSQEEAEIVTEIAPNVRTAIIPNGTDCKAISPQPLGKDILFVGGLTWSPNRDAAQYFMGEILPLIRAAGCQAEVLIVGADPDVKVQHLAASDGHVQLPGRVPDIAQWYARAAVVINPMRGGGGTRLKVLEALAAGRPVVTTRIGAEGLDVSDGKEVCLADDPAAFAEKVLWLLRNREAAQAMGRAGRVLVEARYDWTRCLAPLETLYSGLVPKKVVSC